MGYDFTGKVALVTGAASGIGRATALAFARNGASVVVSDVNDEGGAQTAGMIEDAGGKASYKRCNVASSEEVTELVDHVEKTFGRLDYAFNNAGISNFGCEEFEDDVWDRAVSINLSGVMYCMREEARLMLKTGGGAMVNTSSINGITGNAKQAGYVATKHGVVGLTRHGALRWAREGIRVNAVCPGVIKTPMTDPIRADEQMNALIESMTPMGRIGEPEEIAAAVLWLCSDEASFVTGHPLVVDGASTAI